MNQAVVDQIVNAVLYEGYLLYPYRPSVKNRQRWTFGGLYPRAYSEAQEGSDAWAMQTECLVRGGPHTTVQVKVRFLALLARMIGELDHPQRTIAEGEDPAFHLVESLRVADKVLHAWQEATEREVVLGEVELNSLLAGPRATEFAFPASRQIERVRGPNEDEVGVIVRQQQPIAGVVQMSAAVAAEGLFSLRVRIENLTPLDADRLSRDEALMRSLASTHTLLGVSQGEFVSLMDPPDEWRALAAGRQNVGTRPVLVGEAPAKDTMLSSPIILYDYPQIAQESPGDLFDATEIDEILTLRILTLTDEEKQAVAAVDERGGAMLRRTEELAREQLLGLHASVRSLRPVESCHE